MPLVQKAEKEKGLSGRLVPIQRIVDASFKKSQVFSVIQELERGVPTRLHPVVDQTEPRIVMSGRGLFSF